MKKTLCNDGSTSGADLALKCDRVPNNNVDMTVHQGGCGGMPPLLKHCDF